MTELDHGKAAPHVPAGELTAEMLAAAEARKKATVDRACLFDDLVFMLLYSDEETAAEFLNTYLKKDGLKILTISTQKKLAGLGGRAVVLDALAVDSRGNRYDIEVQRDPRGATARRARFYAAMVDAHMCMEPGDDFSALAETYVIYMAERDVMGLGWATYEYEFGLSRLPAGVDLSDVPEEVRRLDAGVHIIYVNGANRDLSTPEGRMAHDFRCTRAEDMLMPRHRAMMAKYKDTAEGRKKMYDFIKEIYGDQINARLLANTQEVTQQVTRQVTRQVTLATKAVVARNLLTMGLPPEQVARGAELTLAEVERLRDEATAGQAAR